MSERFVAVVAVEDTEPIGRADLRIFPAGAFSWMQLPLTAHVMTVIADEHDGAEVAARVDALKRVSVVDAAALFPELEFRDTVEVVVVASGEFDSGDAGAEAERLVTERTLRRVSVQPRNIAAEWECIEKAVDEETGEEYCVLGAVRFLAYQIAGFTILDTPGVEATDIRIATIDDVVIFDALDDLGPGEGLPFTEGNEPLTASVQTLSAPTGQMHRPPASYFANPELTEYTRVQILSPNEDGWMRIVGHVAPHTVESQRQCHRDFPNECKVAPVSPTNYETLQTGIGIQLDDGSVIHPGRLTMGGPHAPLADRNGHPLSAASALEAYSDAEKIVAWFACGDDGHAWWISGIIRPDLSADRLLMVQGGAPSGDWRWVPGVGLDAIALHIVNTVGFEAPARPQMMVASVGGEDRVVGLITVGDQIGCRDEPPVTGPPADQVEVLTAALLDEIHGRILGDDTAQMNRLDRSLNRRSLT